MVNLPKINATASSIQTYSSEKVELFSILTGDMNPIHLDSEFAKKSFFGKKIVHGMLVASQISSLIANELPGPGSIYLYQDLKFVSPVYHGDIIECVVKVIDVDVNKSIISITTICRKPNENIDVIIGNAKIKIL